MIGTIAIISTEIEENKLQQIDMYNCASCIL